MVRCEPILFRLRSANRRAVYPRVRRLHRAKFSRPVERPPGGRVLHRLAFRSPVSPRLPSLVVRRAAESLVAAARLLHALPERLPGQSPAAARRPWVRRKVGLQAQRSGEPVHAPAQAVSLTLRRWRYRRHHFCRACGESSHQHETGRRKMDRSDPRSRQRQRLRLDDRNERAERIAGSGLRLRRNVLRRSDLETGQLENASRQRFRIRPCGFPAGPYSSGIQPAGFSIAKSAIVDFILARNPV